MTGTAVKICGIKMLDDALLAVEAGADMLGFNFYKPGPRYISVADTLAITTVLRDRLGEACPVLVGIFVNMTVPEVGQALAETSLDYAQLHGDETPSVLQHLNRCAYKAIRPRTVEQASHLAAVYSPHGPQVPGAPDLLVDAFNPALYGGTGEQASAELALAAHANSTRLMLAGGLTPENVAGYIERIRPWGVDVASGVEIPERKGYKDPARVRAFIDAVRAVDRADA